MKYTSKVNVRWHETNAIREMSPSSILALMQESANRQIIEKLNTPEELRDKYKKAFILSKIYMRFYEPIEPYTDISVSTWTNAESRGFSFFRSFDLKKGERVVADAETLWALLDTESGKLCKVEDLTLSFEHEPSLDIVFPRRIISPDMNLCEVGKKKILFSDIDYNSHMNNTHYPNMLFDFLPSPEGKRAKELYISFMKGAMFGEEIRILRSDEIDNTYYFRTLNDKNEVCIEAFIKVENTNKKII